MSASRLTRPLVPMDDKARERYWWDHLVSTKQKSQQAYDDGILKVCGGSLGVSFAFASNFIEGSPASVWLLLLAWACWAVALVGVIASHRLQHLGGGCGLGDDEETANRGTRSRRSRAR